MGFFAEDIGTIPNGRYNWYVFFLEDSWIDEKRKELSRNFKNFSREIGIEALAISGLDLNNFNDQVTSSFSDLIGNDRLSLPALIITDKLPSLEGEVNETSEEARVIYFSLASKDWNHGEITELLSRIAKAIKEEDTFDRLQRLDKRQFDKRWGWLTRYFDLKPGIAGFSIDIDAMINDHRDRDS